MDGVVCAGLCEFGGDAEHALEGVRKENGDKYERYLEAIGDLCDDGALCEEAKESLADGVWQRKHEDAKGGHLHTGERVDLTGRWDVPLLRGA